MNLFELMRSAVEQTTEDLFKAQAETFEALDDADEE